MRRDSKCQEQIHTARVALYWRVDESLDFGESDHLVKTPRDLRPLHAEDRAVQIDVLSAGQFGMKARAHFEQGPDPAAHFGSTFSRLGDTRQDLDQGALPRSLVSDPPQHFTAPPLHLRVP